jgi:glycosyltransferase involved in cell wall biosynthesis
MKIGIDARLLSEPVTGIGRYTVDLTRQLIKLRGEFCLYTPGPAVVGQWLQGNTSIRSAEFSSRITKMIWSQSYLPYWAAKDRVDVFWGATHRLPRYLPASIARVVTIHDLVWKQAGETMRPLSRWIEKRLMPEAIYSADRIIADSFNTAQEIKEEYPEAGDRVRVVQLGLPELPAPLGFQSLVELGIDREYFLFVGTLEPRKNLHRLLKAYAQIDAGIRNNTLLVIAGGKGWGNVDIDLLIKKIGLATQVTLVGYVDDVQLATLYAHARFLVMPSLYEGFGLPLIEAMSFGVPVLTSNCSAMPEVAGDAGVLVDPLDENSIAKGLLSLLDNETYRDQLATKAKPNAAQFSWQKAARETWSVFEEAVAERRSDKGRNN